MFTVGLVVVGHLVDGLRISVGLPEDAVGSSVGDILVGLSPMGLLVVGWADGFPVATLVAPESGLDDGFPVLGSGS